MIISDLHYQDPNQQIHLPQQFSHHDKDEDISDLEGETFPEEHDEADFDEDVKEGIDVLMYTRMKLTRPWVGCVVGKKDTSTFTIKWYEKKKVNHQGVYRVHHWRIAQRI